ncbi:MAG: glycosyltransferase [Candidatus Limnocylindrales bacterium]
MTPIGRVGVGARPANDLSFVNQVADAAVAAGLEIGYDMRLVRTPEEARGLDTLILPGPPERLLGRLGGATSAGIIAWYTEPLARAPFGPGSRVLRSVTSGHILGTAARALPFLTRSARFRDWWERAAWERDMVRNKHELLAMWKRFEEVVVTDQERASALSDVGRSVRVIPIGYHAALAGPIIDPAEGQRPIEVFFFGRHLLAGRRRFRLLARLREELSPDVTVTVPDEWIQGDERAALLARVKVVIDIHRVPGAFSPERHILATAAGAALITEPLPVQPPYTAGTHHIEVPIDGMADAVRSLLAEEDRRVALVRASQALVEGPLDMRVCMRALLGGSTTSEGA